MKKIIAGFIVGMIVGGGIFFTLSAGPSNSKEELILQKIDKILENQQEMFKYLKFIKNRSR